MDTETMQKQLEDSFSNLSDFDMTLDSSDVQKYSTELLDGVSRLEPSMTPEQLKSLVDYARGSADRPDFMDVMLTQTNDKLTEILKIVTMLQLLRLPQLSDYLNALQKTLLDTNAIQNMSYEDMSQTAVNVQKEISEILNLGLKVSTQVSSMNMVPTKVEKMANALMSCSESTRARIEEILSMEALEQSSKK